MKYALFVVVLIALLLSGCGAPAAATIDAAQVQASAATMVALTQAAIPTESPPPAPTDTPLPTPSPTSEFLDGLPTVTAPTTTPQGGQDDCLHPLDAGAAGPSHPTLIKNQTGATVNISLTLYKPNAYGQCGSISYSNVGKNSSVMVQLPSGYWYAYAWASGTSKGFTVSGSLLVQPAVFAKLELCVRTNLIKYSQAC